MNTKVIQVQVTFNKDELFKMLGMIHDSTAHWQNHLTKAEEDPGYHLTPEGCRAVLANSEQMYSEISELYHKHFD